MTNAKGIFSSSVSFVFLLLLICSCGAESAVSDSYPENRRELLRAFRKSPKIIISYAHASPYSAFYDSVAQSIASRESEIEVLVKADDAIHAEDLQTHAMLFLGKLPTSGMLSPVARDLPISFSEEALTIQEATFEEEGVILHLNTYPNPLNPSMPLWLTTGSQDEDIVQWFKDTPNGRNLNTWRQWGVEVFQGSQKLAMGQFAYSSDAPWQISEEAFWDLRETETISHNTDHFQLSLYGEGNDSSAILRWSEELVKAANDLTVDIPTEDKIPVQLYPTAEKKGLVTGSTKPCHCEVNKKEIFLTTDHIFDSQVKLGIRHCLNLMYLGEKGNLVLQAGLAISQLEEYEGHSLSYWEERLYQAGYHTFLPELMKGEIQLDITSKVDELLLASWVTFLKSKIEEKELSLAIHSGGENLFQEKWVKEWKTYLKQTYGTIPPAKRVASSKPLWYQGFNLAHEGYQIYNGYISDEAMQATSLTRELGANAGAIVPYSFMRDPTKPTPFYIPRFAGGETDESVACLSRNSHKLGLSVLIKPQIWIRGSWPGDIEMSSEKEWDQFFYNYERWMMHYAFLAEIYQADMLCIGVEMVKTTLQHPDKWRAMTQNLRRLYSGPIVYAANWGEEFEQAEIWDAMDYIGFNCYYPMSEKEKPTLKELKKTFSQTAEKAKTVSEKFQRPLMFTEIGFRSIEAPWKHPHAEAGGAAVSEEDQALAYQAVCEVLQPSDWMNGIFWWKWPSYTQYPTEESKSFTPMGKQAQEVVADWFQDNLEATQ